MMQKSAITQPFLPASSNGRIASIYDHFQSLTKARNELESCANNLFQLLKGILNRNATEVLTFRLRIASYRYLLRAQFRCSVEPAIHSLVTKF
ncbi:hypothetical protein TNCV_1578381 [Trichonephila clavipes]|nr:hypothetical protein TNCV_1578381 [Trichonephila clavipes]